jgi:hypothetical protein
MGKEEWHGKNWIGSINEERGNNEIDTVCTVHTRGRRDKK